MTVDHSHDHSEPREAGEFMADGVTEKLAESDRSTEQFLSELLAVQCRLSGADSGAIIRGRQGEHADILALWGPEEDRSTPAVWLTEAIGFFREAAAADSSTVKPLHEPNHLYGQPVGRHIVLVPLKVADLGELVAAFLVATAKKAVLEASRRRLELASNLVSLFEKRLIDQKEHSAIGRLKSAMEALSAINRQSRFAGAVMTFCNEAASQWRCERGSIGFLKGRYVQLKAMSHVEHFSRKMKAIQDIESAMEECLEQDVEVLYPPAQEATYISRATSELSKRYGPLSILSLPMRRGGEPLAVLTLERAPDLPFDLEEVEAIRLACELCTPRLLDLYEHGRWVGAKVASGIRNGLGAVVGSKHTWAKIAAILACAAIAFLVFAKGEFRVTAPFVLEASHLQVVPAPFEGYIKNVNVEVGELVEGSETVLAELDTAELRLTLASRKAEKIGYLKQAAAARRDGETARSQIAQADADKAQAQIELLQYLIDRAKITSPIDGTIVRGDLKREVGAPVKIGDVLFEVTPLESLRAELMVSEDQIADIAVDQEGYLATASYPGQRIKFLVERVNPVAEVVKQRNVFRVRVRLQDTHAWMRPGMEGVAKVSVGRRRYVWMWTRRVVNWIRMKLWL